MATYMWIAVATGEEHQIHRPRQTMDPTGRKLEDTTSGLHFTFKQVRYYFPTAFKFAVYYFYPIRDDLRVFYGE